MRIVVVVDLLGAMALEFAVPDTLGLEGYPIVGRVFGTALEVDPDAVDPELVHEPAEDLVLVISP